MKKVFFFIVIHAILLSCVKDTFKDHSGDIGSPRDLRYMDVVDAREGKMIVSSAPTVATDGLIPYFEIVGGYDADGNPLENAYMQHVTISNPTASEWKLNDKYFIDDQGDTLRGGIDHGYANAGIISIANGNNFSAGDYYFTIKVTTEHNGVEYATVFDNSFHLNIGPLLPSLLLYQPKTQNLVYGHSDSKTSAPLIPKGSGNTDVRFELENNTDKLQIDSGTGVVSLSPSYVYTAYDTIRPIVKVTSNISDESVSFSNILVVIVTDVPEIMPLESIHFFYPTLATTGALPVGGDGFSVQTIVPGSGTRRWGAVSNSQGKGLGVPAERPESNAGAVPIEIETNSSASVTTPINVWLVMDTRDLSSYNLGYDILMKYYYMPGFQNYMADGRTPTDLEVYISTDYTGGTIQDTSGNWTGNGTWTRINEGITSEIGTMSGANLTGWSGTKFVGTPYPGNQAGDDPDGKKDPAKDVYNKWVRCSYDLTPYKDSKTFTVAFKVASYFTGQLTNNASARGRGGRYFISDFQYEAREIAP